MRKRSERKVWIVCGWGVLIAGIVLIVAAGFYGMRGNAGSQVFPAVLTGAFFMISGWNFIVRGRQLPSYLPAGKYGKTPIDSSRSRQKMMQRVGAGSLIILGVALIVGLLFFLSTHLK